MVRMLAWLVTYAVARSVDNAEGLVPVAVPARTRSVRR